MAMVAHKFALDDFCKLVQKPSYACWTTGEEPQLPSLGVVVHVGASEEDYG